jgi:hypothetical protein
METRMRRVAVDIPAGKCEPRADGKMMRRAGGTAQDDFGAENVSSKTCQSGDLDPNKFPDRGADPQMMWCDMERDGFHNLIELFFEEES